MRLLATTAALSLSALPGLAQDFASESDAKSWGLAAEKPARFEAQVVDLLCTLTGDCPDDCGGGHRQLGLLRSADGVLVFPNKNGQPLFTGAAVDLAPFCGKEVEVDGLLIEDPELGAQNIYLVQKIREKGGAWIAATRWTDAWAAANPDADPEQPWFRQDPRVNGQIEEHGYLGLGQEADAAFIEEWF
ncbi:MAG: hypothetical protein KDA73_01310 [Rhodobacteraceae bacterium]|nr:hypothetical protein [Paracoccaceae bacterium]